MRERALRTLLAVLQADPANAAILNGEGAASSLQNIAGWTEVEDEGYREELHQLHAGILNLLAGAPGAAQAKDEL